MGGRGGSASPCPPPRLAGAACGAGEFPPLADDSLIVGARGGGHFCAGAVRGFRRDPELTQEWVEGGADSPTVANPS